MNDQKLYRSETDRRIAGVCGGLAKFFNVDATLVRFVFLLLFFLGGSGFLLYFILWIIVPQESRVGGSTQDVVQANAEEMAQTARNFGQSVGGSSGDVAQSAARNGPLIFAVLLIVMGVWFLLQNLLHIELGQFWPVILIVIGLALLIPAMRKPNS